MYIEWIQLERRKEREKDSSIRIGIGIGVHGMKERKWNEMDWDCSWN
jgi:hypothetical protein